MDDRVERSAQRSPNTQSTYSERLFGVRFRDTLPWELNGYQVHMVGVDEMLECLVRHADELGMQGDVRWFQEPMSPQKRRFLSECDRFAIMSAQGDDERVVGACIGHPLDWSSYYIRSFVVSRSIRGIGLPMMFLRRLSDVLQGVVLRIETDVAPHNAASLSVQMLSGFRCVGSANTTRWGALLRYVKFLDAQEDAHFVERFCAGTNAPVDSSA